MCWKDGTSSCMCLVHARAFIKQPMTVSAGDVQDSIPYILRYTINGKKCRRLDIDMLEILSAIHKFLSASTSVHSTSVQNAAILLTCDHNPDAWILEVYLRISHPFVQRVLESLEDDTDEKVTAEVEQQILFTYQAISNQLFNDVLIRGLRHIQRTVVRECPRLLEPPEFRIMTVGSQLEQIWQWPEVDFARTISSDLREIELLLGIEAARTYIYETMDHRMKQNQCQIAMHWLTLLADYMTRSGWVVPITASGLAQESTSVIRNASFEKVIEHIKYAGMFGMKDRVLGNTENVALTQICPTGTGVVYFAPQKDAPTARNVVRIPTSIRSVRDTCCARRTVEFFARFWPTTALVQPCDLPQGSKFLTLSAVHSIPTSMSTQPAPTEFLLDDPFWLRDLPTRPCSSAVEIESHA